MHQVREFLNFIDVVVGTFWGFTVIDILPKIYEGDIVFSRLDNLIKILFSTVGLIYAVLRLIVYFKRSKLEEEYRKQEIESLKNKNFYDKFNREFNDSKR